MNQIITAEDALRMIAGEIALRKAGFAPGHEREIGADQAWDALLTLLHDTMTNPKIMHNARRVLATFLSTVRWQLNEAAASMQTHGWSFNRYEWPEEVADDQYELTYKVNVLVPIVALAGSLAVRVGLPA